MKFWIREMGWERGKRVIMNLLGVILNLVCDLNSYRAVNKNMPYPSFFYPPFLLHVKKTVLLLFLRIFSSTLKNVKMD